MENQNLKPVVVIMAAGKGTRMESDLPKVLHQVAGRPLLAHVIAQARSVGAEKVVVVVGHRAEMVRNAFRDEPGISFALQEPQLGTGHALMCAAEKLKGHSGPVMVLSGDVPALRPATLNNLLKVHSLGGHSLTVLGMDLENPGHYGRMITGPDGLLRRIVEYKDASPEERSVGLVNAGVYAARCGALLKYLPKLTDANRQHEYYITDLVALMAEGGLKVGHAVCADPMEVAGVNRKEELDRMESYLASRP